MPPQGYFPKPTKSIVVVSPRNVSQVEAFFRGYVLQIVMGDRCQGGFVGTEADQDWWLEDNVDVW